MASFSVLAFKVHVNSCTCACINYLQTSQTTTVIIGGLG